MDFPASHVDYQTVTMLKKPELGYKLWLCSHIVDGHPQVVLSFSQWFRIAQPPSQRSGKPATNLGPTNDMYVSNKTSPREVRGTWLL